jgi:hypothetical protein
LLLATGCLDGRWAQLCLFVFWILHFIELSATDDMRKRITI